MGRRSRFDVEFKRQAVELVRSSMRPRNEIAASLGIADATLGRWMTAFNGNDDGEPPLNESERAELKALRRERAEWVMERDILKKAMAWVCHVRASSPV